MKSKSFFFLTQTLSCSLTILSLPWVSLLRSSNISWKHWKERIFIYWVKVDWNCSKIFLNPRLWVPFNTRWIYLFITKQSFTHCLQFLNNMCSFKAQKLVKWQGSFSRSSHFSLPSEDVLLRVLLDSLVFQMLREILKECMMASSASKWGKYLFDGGLPWLSAWFHER